jgi:hypothetical protein
MPQSLGTSSQVISLQYISHLHSDWVSQVTYVPHNHSFMSCSGSPTDSLIIRDIDHKMNNYVFKNRKVRMAMRLEVSIRMNKMDKMSTHLSR